ncbi:hypothetical protein HDU76_009433 [Blyttiomyces sp. JEL0837]|nr:hypothetical protein HDU76_009433 [Blyttiomyces sp. JEL0837]
MSDGQAQPPIVWRSTSSAPNNLTSYRLNPAIGVIGVVVTTFYLTISPFTSLVPIQDGIIQTRDVKVMVDHDANVNRDEEGIGFMSGMGSYNVITKGLLSVFNTAIALTEDTTSIVSQIPSGFNDTSIAVKSEMNQIIESVVDVLDFSSIRTLGGFNNGPGPVMDFLTLLGDVDSSFGSLYQHVSNIEGNLTSIHSMLTDLRNGK